MLLLALIEMAEYPVGSEVAEEAEPKGELDSLVEETFPVRDFNLGRSNAWYSHRIAVKERTVFEANSEFVNCTNINPNTLCSQGP